MEREGPRQEDWTEHGAPVRRLWAAVFWQALRDLTPGDGRLDITVDPGTRHAHAQRQQLRADAAAWIYGETGRARDAVSLLTFREVCEIIGARPAAIRDALMRGLVIGPWSLTACGQRGGGRKQIPRPVQLGPWEGGEHARARGGARG